MPMKNRLKYLQEWCKTVQITVRIDYAITEVDCVVTLKQVAREEK